jgi:hypothetical protein
MGRARNQCDFLATCYTLKSATFWDVVPCGSCKNDVSEDLVASVFRIRHRESVGLLLTDVWYIFRPNIFSLLKMEATRSSETSFLQGTHWTTSLKTAFFLVIAVKTSNLTVTLCCSVDFYPEVRGDMFVRNVGLHTDYTGLYIPEYGCISYSKLF